MADAKCMWEAVSKVVESPMLDDATRKQFESMVAEILADVTMTPERKRARLEFLMRETRNDAMRSVVAKAADIKALEILQEFVSKAPDGEKAQAVRNLLEYDMTYGERPTHSVAAQIRYELSSTIGAMGKLFDTLQDPRFPWFHERPIADEISIHMRGGDTDSPIVKELVKMYRGVVRPYIERLHAAGVDVGAIKDWAPMRWSASRMRSDKEGFLKFAVENLDPVEHPDAAATAEHLYYTIMTRHIDDSTGVSIGSGRKIKWKTPEAEHEAFKRFGAMSLGEALIENTQALVQKTILTEHFGISYRQNVGAVLTSLKKAAERRRSDAIASGLTKERIKWGKEYAAASRAETTLAMMSGTLSAPANHTVANVMGSLRQWMVAQFLGFTPTLLVTQDSIVSAFAARFHAGGFMRGVTEQIRNFARVLGDKNARAWAEEQGAWLHFLHAASSNRMTTPFAASERLRTVAGKAATTTMRVGGTYYMENALRSATMMTISRTLGRLAKSSDWLDIAPRYRKVLTANGWNEGSWKLFKKVAKVDETLGTVNVKELPPDLKKLAGAFLFRETDLGVLYPGHYDRAFLVMGGQAGTIPGELAALATQFWSWPLSFVRGPLRRELAMGGSGFVGFCAGMIAAGALSAQTYAILKGEPAFEWDSPTLWMRAVSRSGLLTPIGDTIISTALYDRSHLGPVGDQFDNIVSVIGKAGMDIATDNAEKAARPVAELLKDVTIPNLWMTEFLTNKAMDNIMQEIDPEYYRHWANREKNFMKQQRRGY